MENYNKELNNLEKLSNLEKLYVGNNDKYQVCPKCNGQGIVSKPPWVAGDVHEWVGCSTSYTCDVCNGQKIILVG